MKYQEFYPGRDTVCFYSPYSVVFEPALVIFIFISFRNLLLRASSKNEVALRSRIFSTLFAFFQLFIPCASSERREKKSFSFSKSFFIVVYIVRLTRGR